MKDEMYLPVCDECEKVFSMAEWDNRHTGHETFCPNYDRNEDDEDGSFVECDYDCDCDVNYHSACCPDCVEPLANTNEKENNDGS